MKSIVLIAHDNKKNDMIGWASHNRDALSQHKLFATFNTGTYLKEELQLPITLFKSGPMGGDQQAGSRIVEGEIDCVIFFWDPLNPHPHDVDVKALLRIAVLYNIPMACNRRTADFIISSPLVNQ